MTIRELISDLVTEGESGHTKVLPGVFAAAVGMILLGIGAASDTGWLAIVGGLAGGLGIVLAFVADHRYVEGDLYSRVDRLDKK